VSAASWASAVPERIRADVAVLGSGGAGLMAARHASLADPGLRVVLVSKGLVGRSGCSVMAQGFNAALGPDDDPSIHLDDLVRGGAYLADQELAWAVAHDAPATIAELVDDLGCAFDRAPDGSIHLAPFPGQSRDRKVHRRHLTGLEILTRLRDDLAGRGTTVLEDTRGLDLLVDDDGVRGLLALDVRRGVPLVIDCPVVILAAGGSVAASYRIATPAREKTGDGQAMALRAGVPLRDMEMVQFLSVGLAVGSSKLTGALLEEALRFAGAELRDASGERFMERYDERAERAPRDVVAAACFEEIRDGRGTVDGAVLLDCRPIGRATLEARFADLVERARLVGVDLADRPVPIAPAAHIGVGGVVIDPHARTPLPGLLAAGEDAGGVHGASWAGGNGIAESTVFGRRAGLTAAHDARARAGRPPTSDAQVAARLTERLSIPADAPPTGEAASTAAELADELGVLLWDQLGLRRDAAGIGQAAGRLADLDAHRRRLPIAAGPASQRWQDALDLESRLLVAGAVAASAAARPASLGVHRRSDGPTETVADRTIHVRLDGPALVTSTRPVVHDRVRPPATVTA
jgi:succinate dehydrogenase/fumarate reductase flavoprotein subunit